MITPAELEKWIARPSPYEGVWLTPKEGERLVAEVKALQAALREMVNAFWHIRRLSRQQQAALTKARAALGETVT